MTRTEKALKLILEEGISAKEAAERVGITPAAVSKGKLNPSRTLQNIRIIDQLQGDATKLRARIAELEQLAKEMAEALEYAWGDQYVYKGIEAEQKGNQALSRFREVCGGEK